MMPELPKIHVVRMAGDEQFTLRGTALAYDVLSFWQWSSSDLMSNVTRGALAEYLVARAVGLGEVDSRQEWDAHDLTSTSGTRIEVKSAAYIQTWYQNDFSKVVFRTSPTRGWDAATNRHEPTPRRHADVYVFALLAHRDQPTVNPLELDQWEFWAVPRIELDRRKRSQHSISLTSLQRLAGAAVGYADLDAAVSSASAAQAIRSA